MYKKIHAQFKGKNKYLMHLWTDEGYEQLEWWNTAYQECNEGEETHKGMLNEPLKKVYKYEKNQLGLHFGDMPAHQKFLIEKYGTNDKPSTSHREVFFDIEIGGKKAGRIQMELFSTITPKTAENFRAL